MNYYERHIGDYLKDTAHLSLLEHGVYGRLLDVYYTRENGIEEGMTARLIGARSKDELAALAVVLAEFFVLQGGIWTHSRCDREIERYRKRAEHNRTVGKLGGRPRKLETQSEPEQNPVGFQAEPEANPQETLASNQKPVTTLAPKVQRARGTRLPPDWEPGSEGRDFALSVGISGAAFNTEACRFRDYWAAQPGQKGVKLDWPATWRNWCRKVAEYGPKQANGITTPGESVEQYQARMASERAADRARATPPPASVLAIVGRKPVEAA